MLSSEQLERLKLEEGEGFWSTVQAIHEEFPNTDNNSPTVLSTTPVHLECHGLNPEPLDATHEGCPDDQAPLSELSSDTSSTTDRLPSEDESSSDPMSSSVRESSPTMETQQPPRMKARKRADRHPSRTNSSGGPTNPRLVGPVFNRAVVEKVQGTRMYFPKRLFDHWTVDLRVHFYRGLAKEAKAFGYTHKATGNFVVVVFMGPGHKRADQVLKERLNLVFQDTETKPSDEDLLLAPVKLSSWSRLQVDFLAPVRAFVQDLPFSTDPKVMKAQGEHLSKHFKVFVGHLDEHLREDYIEGLKERLSK